MSPLGDVTFVNVLVGRSLCKDDDHFYQDHDNCEDEDHDHAREDGDDDDDDEGEYDEEPQCTKR